MSLIFTLKGCTSNLSIDLVPPIELNPQNQYGLALIGFYSYNTIPNIEDNTYFRFWEKKDSVKYNIKIPTGTYEINDLENFLQKHLIPAHTLEDSTGENIFFLRPNNNTQKCEIFHKTKFIDFSGEDSLGSLLGFSKSILTPGEVHESDLPVNIIKVRTIHIDSNITSGAYYNDTPSHTIYEFSVNSEAGYSIDETPKNLIYLPVTTTHIDNITLNILDQNFNLVNFRGEEVIVTLELKKWS